MNAKPALRTLVLAGLTFAALPGAAFVGSTAAQEPSTPAQIAEPPAPPVSDEEAALQVKADAFEAVVRAMAAQVNAAIAEGGTDEAIKTRVETILAAHDAPIRAFAEEIETYVTAQADAVEDAEAKAEILASIPEAQAGVLGIPDRVRQSVERRLAAQAAAPAAQ